MGLKKICCSFQLLLKSEQVQDETVETNGLKRQMKKQRDRRAGVDWARWLKVCSSYICVSIDVIIPVVNIRLWDKPAKDGEEREGGCGALKQKQGDIDLPLELKVVVFKIHQ